MSKVVKFKVNQDAEKINIFGEKKFVVDDTIVTPDFSSAFLSRQVSLCDGQDYEEIEKICTITSRVVSG